MQDLKPENLLLSEKPNNERPPILKLADFGIAKKLKGTKLDCLKDAILYFIYGFARWYSRRALNRTLGPI